MGLAFSFCESGPDLYHLIVESNRQISKILITATALLLFVQPVIAAVPEAKNKTAKKSESKSESSKLVSRDAGRVGESFVTSREILANSLIEDKLFRSGKGRKLQNKAITDRVFLQETTAVLLERAISLEAKDFPVAKVSLAELKEEQKKVAKELGNLSAWKVLEISEAELKSILSAKLAAKKFLQFKVDSWSLPVGDMEAKAYYDKNKFKFENMPFEQFKSNIKSYLTKKQVDDRLREWFEVLKIKYSIRNHLAESRSV